MYRGSFILYTGFQVYQAFVGSYLLGKSGIFKLKRNRRFGAREIACRMENEAEISFCPLRPEEVGVIW
jgi:hypothetical protein